MGADDMQVRGVSGDGQLDGHRHDHGHDADHHAHGHHHHHHDEPMSQEEAVRSLLMLGEVALSAKDYESAVQAYASVLKLEENEAAAYNLGSFYARGLGVRQDFAEAARLFHQAELLGNGQAARLCGKCLFDYVSDGFDAKSPADLYAAMAVFVSRVYPEADDARLEVDHGLVAVASTHFNRGAYAEAAKVFRAAAEFGNDGLAQYYLAQLYNAGAGLPQNDLAALYWLDRAADSGVVDVAPGERDAMLDAYRKSCSALEFCELMLRLSSWCEKGTPDVPVTPDKVARWREAV